MNAMMTAHPPARAQLPDQGETDIAQYVASAETIDALAAGGYLVGRDGHLIARELRAPQLRRALMHSVCYAIQPEVDDFYQEDGEPAADWRRRRTRTVRSHCSVCPVSAACAELALRDGDTQGVRGGLAPEKLQRRLLKEAPRLEQARARDQSAALRRQKRIEAAAEVQRLARQYLAGSVRADKREKNREAIGEAVRRRDQLVAEHRLAAGWTEAA
ncbi:WhiB family transcriptional regulator [Streptomyces niveus]|uniref:WhiB family transcriptional regulator n=1 Tax=Streptomyces niveus TaxID=193462 RepID=UPI0033DA1822